MDKILSTWDRRQEISDLWNSVISRIRINQRRKVSMFCSASGRSNQTFQMIGKVPYSPLNKTHSGSTGTVYCSPLKAPDPHYYANEQIQSCTRNGNTITTVRTIIRRVDKADTLRRCESSPTMVHITTPLRRAHTSSGGKLSGFPSAKVHPQPEPDVEFVFPKLKAPPPPGPKFTIPTLSSRMKAVRHPKVTEQSNMIPEEESEWKYMPSSSLSKEDPVAVYKKHPCRSSATMIT